MKDLMRWWGDSVLRCVAGSLSGLLPVMVDDQVQRLSVSPPASRDAVGATPSNLDARDSMESSVSCDRDEPDRHGAGINWRLRPTCVMQGRLCLEQWGCRFALIRRLFSGFAFLEPLSATFSRSTPIAKPLET